MQLIVKRTVLDEKYASKLSLNGVTEYYMVARLGARPILTNHPQGTTGHQGPQGTREPPASKLPGHQIPVDSEKNMKKYYC